MHDAPLRLFFGLACPPGQAREIAAWRDSLPIHGRSIPPADLHLTLAFLGQQPQALLPQLLRIGDTLHAPAFEVHLDRVQQWSGVLVLVPSQPADGLLHVQAQLAERLLAAGLPGETRPFRPHLTLLHHAHADRLPSPPPIAWTARRWGLFSSHPGNQPRYRLLASWPLSTTTPR